MLRTIHIFLPKAIKHHPPAWTPPFLPYSHGHNANTTNTITTPPITTPPIAAIAALLPCRTIIHLQCPRNPEPEPMVHLCRRRDMPTGCKTSTRCYADGLDTVLPLPLLLRMPRLTSTASVALPSPPKHSSTAHASPVKTYQSASRVASKPCATFPT